MNSRAAGKIGNLLQSMIPFISLTPLTLRKSHSVFHGQRKLKIEDAYGSNFIGSVRRHSQNVWLWAVSETFETDSSSEEAEKIWIFIGKTLCSFFFLFFLFGFYSDDRGPVSSFSKRPRCFVKWAVFGKVEYWNLSKLILCCLVLSMSCAFLTKINLRARSTSR